MKIDIDIKSDRCDFEQCVHYEGGICQNNEARKDCLDIALTVLCVKQEVDDAE